MIKNSAQILSKKKIALLLLVCFFCCYPITETRYWQEYAIAQDEQEQFKLPQIADIKISIIIPCYYKHACHLYSLLRRYEHQTRLPDEVVISLSEVQLVDEEILKELQNERWAFPVTLLISDRKQLAGQNRNSACRVAKGDVFICQDADDIPHPQRVEVIHYFFSRYKVNHLMHRYTRLTPSHKDECFTTYFDPEKMMFASLDTYEKAISIYSFTNGNIAMRRQVFDTIKWTNKIRGEDVRFNREAYIKVSPCFTLRDSLYGYRQYLSSSIDSCERIEKYKGEKGNKRGKCYAVEVVSNKDSE